MLATNAEFVVVDLTCRQGYEIDDILPVRKRVGVTNFLGLTGDGEAGREVKEEARINEGDGELSSVHGGVEE